MKVYSASLGTSNFLPVQVAEWLRERNEQFPRVLFEVNRRGFLTTEIKYQNWRGNIYSHIYRSDPLIGGIYMVSFLYLKEIWYVRIYGGFDERGMPTVYRELVKREFPEQYRMRIAGVTEFAQEIEEDGEINPNLLGEPRSLRDGLLGDPNEVIEINPDEKEIFGDPFEWGDVSALCRDPQLKPTVLDAVARGNWALIAAMVSQYRCV